MSTCQPVIKWSGGKRKSAPFISRFLPENMKKYIEPFLGGGAMLPHIRADRTLCSDICGPLIELWIMVRDNPEKLALEYRAKWQLFQKNGSPEYYKIRADFNKSQSPEDFLFLSRTCVNGMIRFNKKGEFNSPVHWNRPGINPDLFSRVVMEWSERIKNVSFSCSDYERTVEHADKDAVFYLDPPYFNNNGWYYGKFDSDRFFAWLDILNSRQSRWLLSYDGRDGYREYDTTIPHDLFKRKMIVQSCESGFRKIKKSASVKISESLYINF